METAPTVVNYVPLMVMIIIGTIFGLTNIFAAEFLGPRKSTRAKLSDGIERANRTRRVCHHNSRIPCNVGSEEFALADADGYFLLCH